MKPFSSLMQNGRNERMQNPQRKNGRIKALPEEAGDGVMEDGEAVEEVTGIEEMKESRKLRIRNSTKVKLNVTDTGASNPISRERRVFRELDTSVVGKVRFGDNSVIDICGRGIVLFKYKTDEHLILLQVYYVPKLKSNIISLG
ncbi:hypothetical protein SDJN03_21681, partial [Cucurbita argyrosperma subsp. sororia]